MRFRGFTLVECMMVLAVAATFLLIRLTDSRWLLSAIVVATSRGMAGTRCAIGVGISVICLTNTAAALSLTHIETLKRLCPNARLYSMYGLTECKRCTYLPPEDVDRKPESVGIAIPNFWFAILLILLFAVKLQWFSAGGFPGWDDEPWQALKALILPAVSLAVVQAAILARITRSAVLDVLREDFVRTARAKGLSQNAVLWRHVLRNAMVPVLTVMGLQFANLVTGTIVVEQVFALPGLGRLIFQAISNRDVLLVQGIVMLLAATVIVKKTERGDRLFMKMVTDGAYQAIDNDAVDALPA